MYNYMNLIAHILVAVVYGVGYFSKLYLKKISSVMMILSASVLLVLTGICENTETYLVCIIWALVDLIIGLYSNLTKKDVNKWLFVAIQIIFMILWFYFRNV